MTRPNLQCTRLPGSQGPQGSLRPSDTWAFVAGLLTLCLASCASWKPLIENDGWTLYVQGDPAAIETAPFTQAMNAAFGAVEGTFGAFEDQVKVHAWNGGVVMAEDGRGKIVEGGEALIHEVPGIGAAKVQAFHARRGAGLFQPSGVFMGTADPGTAVHELVHARLAEMEFELPLWLEEGLASFMGDGLLFEEAWVVDGLACWPIRELRGEPLGNRDLERLLKLRPNDTFSLRENVLVHFLGWAIVFDLFRESGKFDWPRWVREYGPPEQHMRIDEARTRLTRTLAEETPGSWMARLQDPEPGVRLATAKGVWKLGEKPVVAELIKAISEEEHPEVRVGLAINSLAAAGEIRLDSWLRRRLWRFSLRVLRDAKLADPVEQNACHAIYRAYRYGMRRGGSPDEALEDLKRFWAE